MAGNIIGNIEQFDPKTGDITSYMERLEQLFICNTVEPRLRVSLLLTLIGGEAYTTLKDILTPDLPASKSYEELRARLVEHYSPKRLQIAERYKFWNAQQEVEEDIKSFIKRLKSLSLYCDFGPFLQEAWRDKFVCGITSQAIKRKLLSMDNLTFEIAIKEALSMELADGQVKSMNPEQSETRQHLDKLYNKSRMSAKVQNKSQNVTAQSQNQMPRKPCFRCGRKHDPKKCPAKEWECFKCRKRGHTSHVCRGSNVHYMEEDSQEGEQESCDVEEDEESLFLLGFLSSLEYRRENPLQVCLDIEGRKVPFEIDSGACRSVMHKKDYDKYFSHLDLFKVKYDLRVLTGEGVNILGEVDVFVSYNNNNVSLPLVVLDSKHKFVPLLGRNWLNVLNPSWRDKLSCLNYKITSQSVSSKPSQVKNVNQSDELCQLEVDQSQNSHNRSVINKSKSVSHVSNVKKDKVSDIPSSSVSVSKSDGRVKSTLSDAHVSCNETSVKENVVDLSAQMSNSTSDTVNGKRDTECLSDSIPINMSPNVPRELGATHGAHLEDNDNGSANVSCDSAKNPCDDLPTTCNNQPCSSPKPDTSVKISRFGRAIKPSQKLDL
nr:unnamed protein product [Callosobruchus chinensis]